MGHTCFDVTIKDQIAHIVLNRPDKRNCMNNAFWDELPAIVNDIDHNARARVIVISSTGPHFTSGLDISAFTDIGGGGGGETDAQTKKLQHGPRFYKQVLLMQESFNALEKCRLPVLTAVQGGCIGGGVDFASACDMRYASEDAYFTIYEVKIGMTADVGTFPRIVKLIPEGIVRELAYTGRRMYAEEALRVGLINQVYPTQESMLEGVMEIAAEIANNAPSAVYGCKQMINYARDHSTADGLDYVAVWNMSMLAPEQMMEAMAANAQNRPGNFVELPKQRTKVAKD